MSQLGAAARTGAFAALLALVLTGAALAQTARIEVPGAGVSMVPPEGFEQADSFVGLRDPINGTTIVLTPAAADAFEELEPIFTSAEDADAFFGAQGVRIEEVFTVNGAEGTIPFMRGTQEMEGVAIGKWVALVGGPQTIFVTGNTPPGVTLAQEDFEALLVSMQVDEPPSLEEQVAALPFAISAVEPFQFIRVMEGNTVALVDADTPTGEPQPAIIVDARFGITGMPPVADAAEQMLRAVPGFEVMEITQSEAASLAGSDGWLLAGMADDPEAGSVRVMQWLGVRNGDLIRMIAYAPTAQFDELHDTIEAVAATVAWK